MSMERTEQPTARRMAEARRKGEPVGRSHEMAQAATLVGGLLVTWATLPQAGSRLADMLTTEITLVGQRDTPRAVLLERLGDGLSMIVGLLLPLLAVIIVAAVAANLLSGGLTFSTGAIRFDGSRMNPFTGIKRLVSKDALVRLLVNLAKLTALTIAAWLAIGSRVPDLIARTGAPAGSIVAGAADAILAMALLLAGMGAVIAAGDWIWSRRRARNNLMMTRDQVRREYREEEGSPELRSRRRRRARELAFNRMMAAVPTADVVVVNPIRIAVALRYDSLTMRAPRIVAKGQRLMAARIREIAREHDIPIVEDVLLARALVVRPLNSEVPPHLYRAVAQVLVIVQQARFNLRGRRPGTGAPARAAGAPPAGAAPLALPAPRQPWSPA